MHDAALDRGRTPMTNEIVGGQVVDADCHILEPPDIWENWLPSKYEDKAPKLVKDAEGGDAWLTAVGGEPDPIGLVSTPGMAWDDFRPEELAEALPTHRPICFDCHLAEKFRHRANRRQARRAHRCGQS